MFHVCRQLWTRSLPLNNLFVSPWRVNTGSRYGSKPDKLSSKTSLLIRVKRKEPWSVGISKYSLVCLSSLPVSRPTRPYPGTCRATVPRLFLATQRATARYRAIAWWGPTASVVWRALCTTGPSVPPPPPLSPQRRRGGRWGTTPCGSCMSGSRGRPSPGKVWLHQQVQIPQRIHPTSVWYSWLC